MQEARSDSSKLQQLSSSASQSFSIGTLSKGGADQKSLRAEEKRGREIFKLQDQGVKSKRSRLEFAEKLRKERR